MESDLNEFSIKQEDCCVINNEIYFQEDESFKTDLENESILEEELCQEDDQIPFIKDEPVEDVVKEEPHYHSDEEKEQMGGRRFGSQHSSTSGKGKKAHPLPEEIEDNHLSESDQDVQSLPFADQEIESGAPMEKDSSTSSASWKTVHPGPSTPNSPFQKEITPNSLVQTPFQHFNPISILNMDNNAILSMLDRQNDEEILGSSESEVEDNIEDRNIDTDTEQSADESDENSLVGNDSFYSGKDGTKWAQKINIRNVRTRYHNIVTEKQGVKGDAKRATTPGEAWHCLFPDTMITEIVKYTNIYIDIVKERYVRERSATHTNNTEMKALIGLLFLAGVLRSSHLKTDDLWSKDGSGIDIFPCVMSQQRFHFLLRCLRFDDKNTRAIRQKVDRLSPIRDIFENFVSNCKDSYTIGEYATIDEKLEAFRGKCIFRQYIRSKPARYGIKVFALADAKTYYTHSMEVYVGQQPDGPFKLSNSPCDVVKRLVRPLSGTGRNITTDNWFSSVELAKELQIEHKMTMVCTLGKNNCAIPSEFLITKGREEKSSQFGFNENLTLVSYIPKKNKVVLLLSSMHHDNAIDSATGNARKPEIVTFYNATKGAVDVVDEMSAIYSVSRRSNRWPLTLFYAILNVSGINAQIIFQSNLNVAEKRRTFLKKLSRELMEEHLKYRCQIKTLPKALSVKINSFVNEDTVNECGSGSEPPVKIVSQRYEKDWVVPGTSGVKEELKTVKNLSRSSNWRRGVRRPLPEGAKWFQCPTCDYGAIRKSDLKKHILTHSRVKLFKCSQCSYASNWRNDLNTHLLTHAGIKRYKCPDCDYKTNWKSDLNKHCLMHSGIKQFRCPECTYATNWKNDLAKHILIHSSIKKFKCSECDYRTNYISVLRTHSLKHSGIKKFKCPDCDFGTNSKNNLSKHLLTHSDFKQYKCSECTYGTNWKTDLTMHLLTHSGIKKFKCPKCRYATNWKSDLTKHVLKHSGIKRFKCPECKYRTNRKSDLTKHTYKHTGFKQFVCSECGYGVNQKSHLTAHLLVHPGVRAKIIFAKKETPTSR